MGRVHQQECNQVCVYLFLVIINLGRYPKAHRMVASEKWRCNLSTEKNSTMELLWVY